MNRLVVACQPVGTLMEIPACSLTNAPSSVPSPPAPDEHEASAVDSTKAATEVSQLTLTPFVRLADRERSRGLAPRS